MRLVYKKGRGQRKAKICRTIHVYMLDVGEKK